MKTNSYILTLLFAWLIYPELHAQSTPASPKEFTIPVQATSNFSPASITLNWTPPSGVTSCQVLKKNRNQQSFQNLATNIPAGISQFTDSNVVDGMAYEYCVRATGDVNISGYIYAGIRLTEVHQFGKLLLLIDQTYLPAAFMEVEQYKKDLIAEGWQVLTSLVSRTQSVQSVKQLIENQYAANPGSLKGVILLGHIPVPYSGKLAPDAHANHVGAWPCDMYYGDMLNTGTTGFWTDFQINTATASDPRNHNLISDTKFDVSNKPITSPVQLFIGRIDVFDMPAINTDDTYLFKQYLNKNHAYRSGSIQYRQKAVIDDNFGLFGGEAFAQNGWRNFSSLLGVSNIEESDYITTTSSNTYLWSYGCGLGTFTGAQGIGNTSNFASNQMKSVFTMLYGSYFGDWDNTNNFLRAPIASPSSSLVSIWGGRPNWFLHPMALGEPIGFSYLSSVDNADTYFPKGFYANKIHQNLQGDPTLRMYVTPGPGMVMTAPADNNTKVLVSWTASADPGVLGYYVYRAASLSDSFVLLNTNYVNGTSFLDAQQGINMPGIYMVRAVKLRTGTSGSFYDLSPGTFSLPNPIAISLPVQFLGFTGQILNPHSNELTWKVQEDPLVAGYELERSKDGLTFEPIATISARSGLQQPQIYSYIDRLPFPVSYYRVLSRDKDGYYSYSSIVRLEQSGFSSNMSIFPNPCSDHLFVQYSSESDERISILLRDAVGRICQAGNYFMQTGLNQSRINLPANLPSGRYYLQCIPESKPFQAVTHMILKE